jgi:hypothetical protein
MTPTGEVRGTLMDRLVGLRKMRARLGKHMGPSADETEFDRCLRDDVAFVGSDLAFIKR